MSSMSTSPSKPDHVGRDVGALEPQVAVARVSVTLPGQVVADAGRDVPGEGAGLGVDVDRGVGPGVEVQVAAPTPPPT
jgi:hypothetical protein